MVSLLLSRRDLDFLLHEWLDVCSLTKRERFAEHSRDTIDAVLDLAEQIATRDFAPHNRRSDEEEPRFVDGKVVLHEEIGRALSKYAEAGLIGAGMPHEVGGMQLPATVTQAVMAWFLAANVGTSAYPFLTIANANLLQAYGTQEQVETYVKPMVEGRFFGTMALSEPQAGSSLADITTRAEPQPDGSYKVVGNKMWISAGDHELSENIVHLVLAKIPGGPAGAKGISLLLVPKVLPDGTRNDVQALGYSGYLHALDYARTRPQGRPVSSKDPATPMVAIIEHPDVRRMLLASKSYVEGSLALNLYCGRLVDEQKTGADPERAHLLLELLTPIAKSWPSQWCLAANDLAIQVHGGYGYTREYPVEQLYRDNRLNPIHEGTHGIQALDLLGRKVVMQGGAGLALLAQTIDETVDRALTAGGDPASYAQVLRVSVERVVEVTQKVWGAGDVALSLANASVYLEAVGHVVIAWMWLEQLLAVGEKQGDFYEGKRQAARYFFAWELPKTSPQLDLLASLDRTTLDMPPTAF